MLAITVWDFSIFDFSALLTLGLKKDLGSPNHVRHCVTRLPLFNRVPKTGVTDRAAGPWAPRRPQVGQPRPALQTLRLGDC